MTQSCLQWFELALQEIKFGEAASKRTEPGVKDGIICGLCRYFSHFLAFSLLCITVHAYRTCYSRQEP